MAVSSDLSAVVFGLAASAAWGAGDFSGGMASRRAHTVLVVAAAHGIGLGLMVLLAVASAEALPSGETLFWGALAGIAGCLGLLAFWRGLSIGRMGLVAPVTAVIAVLVPVVVGMFTEGLPGVGKLIGFALALISLWLVSAAHNAGGERTGLGLAVFAGFGFGAFLALIGQVGKTSFFWSLTAARVASFSMMLIVVLTTRRTWQPNNRLFTWIVLAGGGGERLFRAGDSERAAGHCFGAVVAVSGDDRTAGAAGAEGACLAAADGRRRNGAGGDCADRGVRTLCGFLRLSPTVLCSAASLRYAFRIELD
jgi:uncharacterized membrane protein